MSKNAFARLLVLVLPATLLLAWASKQWEMHDLRTAAIAELYASSDEQARAEPAVLQYFATSSSSSACSEAERSALFRAGARMGGSTDWLLRSGWGEAADCCDWKGVGCARGGGVVSLDLANQGLRGTLASELAALPSLARIDINENNALSGTLPPKLFGGRASLTHLYAFGTALSGTLPLAASDLTHSLQELELSSCRLTGTLPTALGSVSTLRHVFLESNKLSGSIPSSLAGLRRLRELELSHNRFSGSLPGRVAHMPLEHLDVAHNSKALRGVPAQPPKQGCSGGSEKYLRGGGAAAGASAATSSPGASQR